MNHTELKREESRSAVLWGRVLSCALILYIVYGLAIYWFKASFIIPGSINHWSFSEFMINYQGGFVRRGLLGEIIFQICKSTGADVKLLISIFSILVYGTLFCYFYVRFKTRHLKWWFLASPLLFGFLDSVIRKDFLMGWLCIFMIVLLRDKAPSSLKRWSVVLISVFGLFIHEAFFFWGIPMGMLLLIDGKKKIIPIISVPLLAIIFCVLCYYRGEESVVSGIIGSWNNTFDLEYPVETTVNAIGALLWDAKETFITHIKNNIGYNYHCMGLFIRPIAAFFAYYLIINFIKVFKSESCTINESDRTNIGAICIYISICMIPMFTIFSNDYARLYQYIALATIGAFITLDRSRIENSFPKKFLTIVRRLNNSIDKILPANKGWFIMVFLIWAAAPGYYDINEAVQLSVIGKLSILLGSIIKTICVF